MVVKMHDDEHEDCMFSSLTSGEHQQSGSVVMIWGGMIGNELSSLFRVPEELNCPLTCIARS